MMKKSNLIVGALVGVFLTGLLSGCGTTEKKAAKAGDAKTTTITVGVTPGYSENILEFVAKEAAKEGLTVKLKTFSDYVTPDQALAQKDIDLNSYQHGPFLEAFNEKNGTKLVSIGNTYLAPLKAYSKKIKDIKEIKTGDKVAIPNDPSNGGRAILLLSKKGLLKVKEDVKSTKLTVHDITENPLNLKIIELEAPQLPRTLDDTAISIINAGYADDAKLDRKLVVATEDNTSPYVNIIAARAEDKDNPTYKKFVKIFQSEPVKQYILKYSASSLTPGF